MKPVFVYSTRIYFEDTDSTGVVYHTNYLKFMERARSEWLISLNASPKEMNDCTFAIREVRLHYKSPARLYDSILVEVSLKKVNFASILFFHQVLNSTSKEMLCAGTVEVVCLNQQFKPQALPKPFLKLINPSEVL